MRFSFFLIVLCVLISACPGSAIAAFVPSSVYVGIRATPEYPEPRDSVTLTASTAQNPGKYSYTWTVDDEVVAEGMDVSTITITAKSAGERTVVLLSITDTAGIPRGETEYVIQPGSVEIAWEGETYVPPFYAGKAFPNKNGRLSIEAIPQMFLDGVRLNKNELVYLWEIDGVARKAESGYGKFFMITSPSRFSRATTVSVTVQTLDGIYAARSSVRIPSADPIFVVYEKLPLAGVQFEKAVLKTFVLRAEEAAFEVHPFFSVNPNSLSYEWFLDKAPFEVGEATPRRATFRREGSGGGIFSVEVRGEKSGELYNRGAAKFLLSLE
jgi:hypothetical protein